MRITVKGRNVHVSEDTREHVVKRFQKVAKQVSELAELEVELSEERNPANPDCKVVEVTLHLKGVTLRAQAASGDMMHSINKCSEELAVQVKRHRDKRRKRREAHAATPKVAGGTGNGLAGGMLSPGMASAAGGSILGELPGGELPST